MNPPNLKQLRLFLLLISLSPALCVNAHAAGAAYTWNVGPGAWNSTTDWSDTASSFPGASGTADTVIFSGTSNQTVSSLGQAIAIASLTSTGNVTISDATFGMSFDSNSPITITSGTLTLNLSSTFNNAGSGTAIVSVGAGSALIFGGNMTTGTSVLEFTGAGTVNFASGKIVTGASSTSTNAEIQLQGGVTLNTAATFNGHFQNNAIEVFNASTLNIQVDAKEKAVLLAASGATESLYVITSATAANTGTFSGTLQVAGGQTTGSQDIAIIGANIPLAPTATGTATITNISSFDNAHTGNQTVVLTAAPRNTLILNNVLSGTSSGTLLVQVTGGGIVDFADATGTNTFLTSPTATNGLEVMPSASGSNTILRLNDLGVSLTGNTKVDTGCTIQLLATNQMTSGTLTLNGSGTTGALAALENKTTSGALPATIVLGSASTIISDATDTLTLSGGIDNGGNTLTVGGAGAVNVNPGETLGGGGLIAGATNLGGTLNPGLGLTTGTTLTIDNTVNFLNGSTFKVNIDTTNNVTDELLIGGVNNNLVLNATDTLTFALVNGGSLSSLAAGTYVIADDTVGTLSGAFTYGTLPSGWTINQSGNVVELVVVPEPSTWAMLLGGVGFLGLSRRLRKRQA